MDELVKYLKSIKDSECDRSSLSYLTSTQSTFTISANKKVWIMIVKRLTSVEIGIKNGSSETGEKATILYIHSNLELLNQIKEAELRMEKDIMSWVSKACGINKQKDRNFSVALKSMMYRKVYSMVAEIKTFGS